MSFTTALQLTPEQRASFLHNGYLRLPGLLSPACVESLRAATDRLCAMRETMPQVAVVTGEDEQPHVIGIEHLVALSEPIFRELLGSPLLLSIAEHICGNDFFPVQDFLVAKSLGDGNEVKWHQDLLTQPLGKTIMVGCYLDPANEENGALRIIPGSHQSELPICALEKMAYTTIEMQAGDVLIHDLMLAHSSGKLTDFPQRRVVYVEFMSAVQAISEQVYSEDFVDLRTELIARSIQCFSATHPQVRTFHWNSAQKFPAVNDPVARIREIYETPRKTHTANYCLDEFLI